MPAPRSSTPRMPQREPDMPPAASRGELVAPCLPCHRASGGIDHRRDLRPVVDILERHIDDAIDRHARLCIRHARAARSETQDGMARKMLFPPTALLLVFFRARRPRRASALRIRWSGSGCATTAATDPASCQLPFARAPATRAPIKLSDRIIYQRRSGSVKRDTRPAHLSRIPDPARWLDRENAGVIAPFAWPSGKWKMHVAVQTQQVRSGQTRAGIMAIAPASVAAHR